MANNNLDALLNAGADNFLNDADTNPVLAFTFYQKISVDDDDAIDQWLNDLNYATDTDHLMGRFKDKMTTSLSMWIGNYRLATESGEIYNLIIEKQDSTDTSTDAPDDGTVNVYLMGLKIKTFTFQNSTLTWDNPDETQGAIKGTLSFSGLVDQPGTPDLSTGSYFGPLCQGNFTVAGDSTLVKVTGKSGVYGLAGLTGGYSATDSLDYWIGKYTMYVSVNGAPETREGELIVYPESPERTSRIYFNEKPIAQYVYNTSTLSWPGKVDNQSVNSTGAQLQFMKLPSKKVINGKIHLENAADFDDAAGIYSEEIATMAAQNAPLKITTTALPTVKAEEELKIFIRAIGGTQPYTWDIQNLPDGLTADAATGLISGKATEAGDNTIEITVTDHAAATDQASLLLTVGEADNALSPVISQVQSWVAPLLSAIFGLIGIFVTYKIQSKFRGEDADQEQDKKNELKTLIEEVNNNVQDVVKKGDIQQNLTQVLERLNHQQELIQAANKEREEAINRINKNIENNLQDIKNLEDKIRIAIDARTKEDLQRQVDEANKKIADLTKAKDKGEEEKKPEGDGKKDSSENEVEQREGPKN